MESSWQRKCAPMWQSSAASVFSSSQHHQNQILSGSYHLHSPVQVKPSSSIRRLVPEAVNPWSSNLSSNNLSLTEPASSFLSLLSGPPCVNPNEVPVSGSHVSGCEAGSDVSLLSSGPFAEYLGSQYPEAGADPGVCVSSKARISANHGSNSALNIVRHGCYRDLQQQLELPKADTHSKLSSNGIRMNFSSGRVGHVNGATAPNVRKIQSSNSVGVSQRVPLKTDSAVSCLSSSVLAGCPQVFCLGLSGVLLLSNTGFLGVLCSCHGLHMSISKFSEHSGLCNVNPGNAVHMDSGETIAQWRKAFCRKFGIRIPEDHSGWDWPQGLSVTTGLVQHGSTLPIMSTDSNLCNQTSSFGASVHSLNQLSQILHPKNAQTGEEVDEFMPREKQKSTQGDSSLLFKGLSSSSKNSLHFVADDHMTGYSRSGCSTMPNLVGIRGHYNVCPVISSYKDPLCESGGFVFPPDMQNLNTLEKDTAVGRSVGSHVDRDTVSSNVELRLGQPSQQNQASESSILSASGSHLLFHGQPRKSVFLDQHLYGSSSSRSIDVSRQHNYLAGIMSSSSTRTEKTQLNDLNHACGAYRVPLNVSQFKQLNKNAPGSLAASESFANLRSPCEGKNHCKSINGSINVSHAVVSKLQSGSSPAKSGQFGFPSPRENVPDTDFFTNILDSHKHEKVENVRHTTDGLHGTAELNLGSHTKSTGRMLSSGGVAGDSDPINYPVSHGKVPNMCQSTGMMANVPDVRNSLDYFGQVSCPAHSGQCDPNYFRTISSPMDLRTILSSELVSLGNSATNSIPGKSFTASAYKRNGGGSPFFLDETLKMLAFQPMSALSDQNLSTSISKTISVQEESQNYGKTQVIIPPGLRKNVCNRTNVPKASEVATHPPAFANLRFGDSEKLPSVIDTSKRCNFQVPAVSQGWYSHGRDTEAQFQFHSDLEQTRQFFLRVGVNGNIASSSEVGNCYQELPHGYFPSKCGFSRKSDNLTGRHHLTGDPSLGEFGEKEGNAVDLGASFFSPKFGKIFTFTEKDNSFGQTTSMVQNMKKAECNSFQWRDVPRKVVKDASEAATKCSEKAAHHTLKEQETSNLSSGCSAPAITQASIEANNKDSYTVDGAVADNLVVDEGSGIERCCSSDDDSERSAEFYGFPSKFNLVDKQSSKENVSKLSLGFFDELQFRDLLKLKKMKCQSGTSFPIQENDSRRGKRKTVKWKRLDSSVTASALPAAQIGALKCAGVASQCSRTRKNIQTLPQGDQQSFTGCPCSVGQNLKRRESTLSSSGAVSWKRDLTLDIEVEKTDSETNLKAKSDYSEGAEAMQRKRLRLVGDTEGLEQDDMHDSTCIVSEITTKVTKVDCNATSSKLMNSCHRRRRRPVVHGKYGIISNGNHLKPAKIVSLKMINKASRRCSFAESGKLDFATVKESKKAISNTKKEVQSGVINMFSPESNSQHSGGQKEMAYFLGSKDSHDLSHTMKKRRHDGSRTHSIPDSNINKDLRRKCKEVRKRSVNELTKGNDSSCVKSPILKDGKAVQSIKSKFISKLVDNAGDDGLSDEKCNDNRGAKVDSCRKNRDLGVFCCVCGSSNKDDSNCLLECNHCLIKVHQACYGVSKVPKARWYCRPCKTNSKNIVCVLCGYGGGAMTRALRTRNVVKSLLRSWSIATKSNSENLCISESLGNLYKMLPSTKSVGVSDPFLIIRPAQMESPSVALWNSDLSELADTVAVPSSTSADPVLCNSITAGVFDSTVKQWVHMVCGLWTPGTRCPNVDTMSAFDVSGACQPKQDVVCSICQRSGGTCIQCRVTDCYIQFHPWCAHQKGLLQSEVEGVDNESVGFYGKCMLHAMHQQFDSDSYHTSSADHGERESTCARTEGYKGRKQDGFHDNRPQHSDAGTGCLVPQEQLNAWIHIHGQKSCTRGPLKLPTSVIEYDCRKEYARYKQSRGWKHLVVYKSGIHGLGLYTSQFISRGAMVVEYVGEIVGLHVADKRETEYQAGKKLQYKSACYFFRIDKEHIIDATRKGGIARFVNHSCLPNCVAKVISVRNEKKVVFFAERDVYPGEEVTYDYHFNHEDEGKKLPCYCNSKNCRRYLN